MWNFSAPATAAAAFSANYGEVVDVTTTKCLLISDVQSRAAQLSSECGHSAPPPRSSGSASTDFLFAIALRAS